MKRLLLYYALGVLADPLCTYKLSSRELLTVDPSKGDEVIIFSAIKVECKNVYKKNGRKVQERWPLWALQCQHGLMWSLSQQGCGKCPARDQLAPKDKERLKALGSRVHMKSCFQSGPGVCSCEAFIKSTTKRGREVWKRSILHDVELSVHEKCKKINAVQVGKRPKNCFSYQKFSNIGFNQQNMWQVVLPELRCKDKTTGQAISYARDLEMPPVYIPPSTKQDPTYHMMRLMLQFGFESELDILETLDVRSNYGVLLFIAEVKKQGNTVKVGPTTREMQENCEVRMNIFLNQKGEAIMGNQFIPASKIKSQEEFCGADKMKSVTTAYQQSLQVLEQINQRIVNCKINRSDRDDQDLKFAKRRKLSMEEKYDQWDAETNTRLEDPFLKHVRKQSILQERRTKIPGISIPIFFEIESLKNNRQLQESQCLIQHNSDDRQAAAVVDFGTQQDDCCMAIKVVLCHNEGTCRKFGLPYDEPTDDTLMVEYKRFCTQCERALNDNANDANANHGVLKSFDENQDGKIDICDQNHDDDDRGSGNDRDKFPSTNLGQRERSSGQDNECHAIPGLTFVGPQTPWCCEAYRVVTERAMYDGGVDYMLDSTEPPTDDEVRDSWDKLCLQRDGYCSKSIVSGLRKFQADGKYIDHPDEDGRVFHEDIGPQVLGHFNPNNTEEFDQCAHRRAQALNPECMKSVTESISSPLGKQCYQALTGRRDGRMVATCKKNNVLNFAKVRELDSQSNTNCQEWICSTYLSAVIFDKCGSSAVCCGAGDATKLIEFCPTLGSRYASMCPQGCTTKLDCRTCHEHCDGCINDFDQRVCRLRCNYEECGEGNPEDGWKLTDGMDCDHQRHILEKTLETALGRAFMFTGMDVYSGCKIILNNWVTEIPKYIQKIKHTCTVNERDELGQVNRKWAEDSCCNREMQRKQCCGPREVTVKTRKTIVNTTAIGLYDAMTNNGGAIALEIAEAYSSNQDSLATACFKPYHDFINMTSNQHMFIKKCFMEVLGDEFGRMHGPKCTVNSDCWTEECAAPVLKGQMDAATGTGDTASQQKYCKTPLDTVKKETATPLMKCLVASSATQVVDYFKYKLEVPPTADTSVLAETMLEKIDGITHYECQGRESDFWLKRTQRECELAQQCNWDWNAKGAKCLDPCDLNGSNPKCGWYCGTLTDKREVSRYPICEISVQGGHWRFHEACWKSIEKDQRDAEEKCRRCQQDCERSRADERCWENCEANVCIHDWSVWDIKFEECVNSKCRELSPSYSVFTQHHDRICIDRSLSFDNKHADACKGDCFGDKGPKPGSPKRCFAVLKPEEATAETCGSFGEAWVEARHAPMEDMNWDWSRGAPAPKWCWLRGYEVLDGKPYKRPPPFGFACLKSCEKELHRCLEAEKCWQWFEDKDSNRHDLCMGQFEKKKTQFKNCEQDNQNCESTEICRTRKRKCAKSVKLIDDEEFKALECMDCPGEWIDYSDRMYQCLTGLGNVKCRWNEKTAAEGASQPCASGCMDTCWRDFENCDKSDKRECETDLRLLNQCRECEFVRCDEERCKYQCNDVDQFHWWGHPSEACSGCDETDSKYKCAIGKECFADRVCFGEKPPFGELCSRGCEKKLETCRDSKRRHCYAVADKKKQQNYEEVCRNSWGLFEREARRCVDEKLPDNFSNTCHEAGTCEQMRKRYIIECGATFKMPVTLPEQYVPMWNNSAEASCFDCHGEWNMWDPWLFEHGDECFEQTELADCKNNCVVTTCDRFGVNCWATLNRLRNCTHVSVGDHQNYESRQVCKISYMDAANKVMADEPTCKGCDFFRCDSVCRDECDHKPQKDDDEPRGFRNFNQVLEHCSGCTAGVRGVHLRPEEAKCVPEHPCFQDRTFDWTSGTKPSISWLDAERKCFHDDNNQRQLSAINVASESPQSSLVQGRTGEYIGRGIKRMSAAAHDNYRWHIIHMREREIDVLHRSERDLENKNVDAWLRVRTRRRMLQQSVASLKKATRRGLLQQNHPSWVALDECKGDACATSVSLCKAFWNRDADDATEVSDEQKRLTEVLDENVPWAWNNAPWENADRICEEIGQICFVSIETAKEDTLSVRPEECDRQTRDDWLTNCPEDLCNNCTLVSSTRESCNHCCRCHFDDDQIAQKSAILHEGSGYVCRALRSLYEKKLLDENPDFNRSKLDEKRHELYERSAASEIYYDDRLLNGNGACKHHIDEYRLSIKEKGEECKVEHWRPECQVTIGQKHCALPSFTFYRSQTRWQKGVLNSPDLCEAKVCDPEPWIMSKEKCEKVNYCRGDCAYCETANYWDWEQSKKKMICVFKKSNGDDLTNTECVHAATDDEVSTTFTANTKSGRGVCKTAPPVDAQGDEEGKCRGSRLVADVEYFFTPMFCRDFARNECEWVRDSFPDMECTIHWMQCKTREDCADAGRCQYHTDDWLVQQDGGICIKPFDLTPEFDVYEGIRFDIWEQCEEEREDDLIGRWAHVGCALFKAQLRARHLQRTAKPASQLRKLRRRRHRATHTASSRARGRHATASLTTVERHASAKRDDHRHLGEIAHMVQNVRRRVQEKPATTRMPRPVGDLGKDSSSEEETDFVRWEEENEKFENKFPGPGMTREDCTRARAKWVPYAHSKSECIVPGYMWGTDINGAYTSGSMACCVEWGGTEGHEECWMFSQLNSEKASCDNCGGKWLSVFPFHTYGQWVVGRWKKSYTWQKRALENKNVWMQTLAWWKLGQEWDKVVMHIQAGPTRNLAKCRAGSALDFLESIATQKSPVLSLGTAELLPGVPKKETLGSFTLESSAVTIADKTNIDLSTVSAASVTIQKAQRRALRHTTRNLATSEGEPLSASCWSKVTNADGDTVGQLIGDCLVFAPNPALSGPLNLCIPIDDEILTNSAFTTFDFGSKASNGIITPLERTATLTNDGNGLCAEAQDSLTYCPIKRLDPYIGSSVVSQDDSCSAMELLQVAISAESATIRSSADYTRLVLESGLVLQGNEIPEFGDESGAGAFGVSGEVHDIDDFVESADGTSMEDLEEAAAATELTTEPPTLEDLMSGESTTGEPTEEPIDEPTVEPTGEPTDEPTEEPFVAKGTEKNGTFAKVSPLATVVLLLAWHIT
eukprot:GEMP01000058.1.p1 GENE.GEMP01000058.1~~GEMP01000058.1.p1  ORF type:complete len:3100 (+),score=473.75 GEMP01000058.1:344-9643(+)